MIHDEKEEKFFNGHTRQELIDRIIEFEIDNDIVPDLGDILEYGFAGYQNVEDEVLKEMYLDYFVDEEYEGYPDHLPEDYIVVDGHGDHIPNDYEGGTQ